MNEIDAKLRKVRPKLKEVAPLTHKIVWSFFWFNMWIGLTVLLQKSVNLSRLIIVGNHVEQILWSAAFFALAFFLLLGLIRNSWTIIRWAMIAGVAVKTTWLYAIIYLGFQTDLEGTMGTVGLWLFAAWIQVLAVAYFLPASPNNHLTRGQNDRKFIKQ